MRRLIVPALTCCLTLPAAALPPSGRVGDYGDPARLLFEGNKTYTADAIREGLAWHSAFPLASHPAAPLDQFVETLQHLILIGYQNGGFPDVKVDVVADDKAGVLRIRVDEGPRYLRGGVRIIGAKTIPVDRLVKLLTEPRRPWDEESLSLKWKDGNIVLERDESKPETDKELPDPIWPSGKPAPFAPTTASYLSRSIETTFWDVGRFFPKLSIEVVPERGKNTAELVIHIQDEGPEGIVDEIEISGTTMNSREEIMAALQMKPGMRLDRETVDRMKERLYRSGRFLAFKIIPKPEEKDGGRNLKLLVDIMEYDKAPRLSEPLSPEEQVALKAREWLMKTFVSGQEDLIMQWRHPTDQFGILEGRVVFSTTQGILMTLHRVEAGETYTFLSALYLSPDRALLLSPIRMRRLAPPMDWHGAVGVVTVEPKEKKDDTGIPFYARVAFGYSTEEAKRPRPSQMSPIQYTIRLAPVAFIGQAHRENAAYTLSENGAHLTVTGKNGDTLIVETASGRILDATLKDAESAAGLNFRFEKGAFERLRRDLDASSEMLPNDYDPTRPLSSMGEFLFAEALQALTLQKSPEADRAKRVALTLQKVMDRHILTPLDNFFQEGGGTSEVFEIPEGNTEGDASMADMVRALSALIFGCCDQTFPRNSWPWVLTRGVVLVASGQGKYADDDISRIYGSPDTGPLGFLASARVVALADPISGRVLAARGLERLSANDFMKDCRLLLEGDRLAAQCASRLVEILRDLDDADVNALAEALDPEIAGVLRACVKALRDGKNKPLPEALYPALKEGWEKSLRSKIEEALRESAGPLAPPREAAPF